MIKENLNAIKNKINDASRASGFGVSVRLLAVSKFHPASSVVEAVRAGQCFFGENRVQEAAKKFDEVRSILPNEKIELHIIGSLQRNKVKEAVRVASCIESVDRLELLQEIEKQAAKIDKKIEVYFELHTGEETKSGYATESELFSSLDYIKNGGCPHIVPKGFMTMAPNTDDENEIRKSFRVLKRTSENAKMKYPEFDLSELSMGMSGDFEIAIEEGSTEVRIGTAIFGERNVASGE